MCGIAGIVGKDVKRYAPNVKAMTDAIAHRGPDGEGVAIFDNCLLGQRRLSIIDLVTGDQPMYSNKNSCLVFNGEFYGYLDTKKQLSYNWKTTSIQKLSLPFIINMAKMILYRRSGVCLLLHYGMNQTRYL
jgi:asparagine synthase (glutamine-hydrolysing)